MLVQYWVGHVFIDLSRNQITQNEQSQTLAPKALAVLTYLAENKGRVVSYDELFNRVWPETIVTPNTLQRSIAQLRKSFGDEGKDYIKTHAKQGYSLECDVRSADDIVINSDVITKTNINPKAETNNETNTKISTQAVTGRDRVNESQTTEVSSLQPNVDQRINTTAPLTHAASSDLGSSPLTSNEPSLTEIAASENATNELSPTENTATESSINSPTIKVRSTFGLTFLPIFAGVLILIISSYFVFVAQEPQPPFSIDEIKSLTATDNKEYAAIYSPDGLYVVFHRYSNKFCSNNIWAKNIETQEEFQLTKHLGSYGSHSFSKDGKQLVFVKASDCHIPINQKKCYQLMTLDFISALESPQTPRELVECNNTQIRTPAWLNNGDIALMQKESTRWKLIRYSINDNKSDVIYDGVKSNVIDYDYSAKRDLIALTSIQHDGRYYIEMLKPDGRVLSSHLIKRPNEIAPLKLIYPNFSLVDNQLIFSTGRQLFTMTYDGEILNISLPLDEPMGSPKFHPNGKRMLVIKGHYDSDILSLSLAEMKIKPDVHEQTKPTLPQMDVQINNAINHVVVERSNVGEDSAIFQPNGELIAYVSERSGDQQVWITHGNGSQQLTHFPMDTSLYGMDWAANGNSVLVNVNYTLTQVFLDSTQKVFTLAHPVVHLFHWDSQSYTALALIRVEGILKFAELDLTNLKVRVINDKKVNWALKTEKGQIIYTDHMDQFWQQGPTEDKVIEALNGKARNKQRFDIKDNVIYGINDNFQLWTYDLNSGAFVIKGDIPQNIDALTDVSQSHLLMSVRVSAKKEVAELLLAN